MYIDREQSDLATFNWDILTGVNQPNITLFYDEYDLSLNVEIEYHIFVVHLLKT